MLLSVMERKTLVPRKVFETDGKLIYNESQKAFATLILKQDFLNEFSQLKERRSAFGYHLKFFRNPEELDKAVKEIKKDGAMPLLVWFYRNNKE
jgi:hypothetical protein